MAWQDADGCRTGTQRHVPSGARSDFLRVGVADRIRPSPPPAQSAQDPMLSPSSIAFLKRLLDTPAPSGFETAAARVWRTEAESFAKVTVDVAGNSMAEVNPAGSVTIMLDGHIDEIGVIVQYIDDDGYIYIAPIGGWDPQVLVGQRIRFLGNEGDVHGVVGKKPIHLMKSEDREHASKFTDFWVDIGATKRDEAEARVSVGDPGVI